MSSRLVLQGQKFGSKINTRIGKVKMVVKTKQTYEAVVLL